MKNWARILTPVADFHDKPMNRSITQEVLMRREFFSSHGIDSSVVRKSRFLVSAVELDASLTETIWDASNRPLSHIIRE